MPTPSESQNPDTRPINVPASNGNYGGAIEAGCKQIVVQRAKQSGMHWTINGAAGIITLRCQHASGRWDELWPDANPSPAGLRAAI